MANKEKKTSAKKKSSIQLTEENKFVTWGLLGVFLVLVFFASSYKITGDDDFFWHLATGRFIVENKYVPDKDVFGFVTQGQEWIPFEWGWDIITYGLYNLGGYNAILIFRSLMFVLIFFLLWRLMNKFKLNSLLSILMLFLLLIGVMDRLSPRPHILTYLFFVLLLTILLNYKYLDREKCFRCIHFIPLIFLVWGNTHMGVLAGGLILFVFTVTELILYYRPSLANSEVKPLSKQHLNRLLIISVVSALCLLINPHGLNTYLYAYSHTKMKMLETVNEWRSPFTKSLDFGFVVMVYKLFLYSGVLLLIYAYKRKDLFVALLTIAFAIYSVRAIRFTVDYEIVMVFFLTTALNYFLFVMPKSKGIQNIFSSNITKGAAGIFFVYIISQIPSNSIYNYLQYYRVYGWGVNEDFIPVQLFDLMKKANISGKPLNHFGTGGYLVWNFPNEKNFLDSRNLNDEIFKEYDLLMYIRAGYEKKLEHYGIDYVVYLDPDLIRRPKDLHGAIVSFLTKNPQWKLLFWDDKSMLFVKDVPKFTDAINQYEYKILKPYTALFDKSTFEKNVISNPDRTKSELERKSSEEPNGVLYQNINQTVSKVIQKN